MSNIQIISKKSVGKFFIPLDETDAHIVYKMISKDTIEYYSTFVPSGYRGKPYAEDLAVFAFDYALKNNLKVIVTCPYLRKFIGKNKELYKDLDFKE